MQQNHSSDSRSKGASIVRQTSNSSAQTTEGGPVQRGTAAGSGPQQQQQGAAGGSWRCEVFVDTPMTREFIHGPLNIQLPPIALPAGLQNLMGLTQADNATSQSLQRQTSLVIGDGIASVTASQQPPNSAHQHQQQITSPSTESRQAELESTPPREPLSSPASTIISWGRASSTPAVSGDSTGESFVIDIDDELANITDSGSGNNRIHRRRSSSPVRPSSQQRKQQGADFSTRTNARPTTTCSPSEPQLTLRSHALTGNNTDRVTTADGTTSTEEGANSGGRAAGGDNSEEEEDTMSNLRQRLQEVLRRRHQIARNIVEQTGEFPSLYMVGVMISFLLVVIFVLIQFFSIEFTACLALLFSVFHYSDAMAFKRYITGTGNPLVITGKIFLRQFMVLSVLGQSTYIFPTATFRETSITEVPNPTFWSTLYIIIVTEYFIMDCILCLKLAIAAVPKCSTMYKRRIYQWIEYSGALYHFAIPFVQWNAYLGAIWWTVLYGGIKILLGLAMAWAWLLTTLRIFRNTHLGTVPSDSECKQVEQCTICFGEFSLPIKLKCAHIFCLECIRTWLDREHTCPICRAIVTKEDNNYRNGESMFPALF